MFVWSFHERQLKALVQFEAKVYSSFQHVAHDFCVNRTKKIVHFQIHFEIILNFRLIASSTLGFFLFCLIVSKRYMCIVQIKS